MENLINLEFSSISDASDCGNFEYAVILHYKSVRFGVGEALQDVVLVG